ncbi:hypothetical protein C9374_010018 [Naegleria lovaniensis]|uniref:Uncharacterized protein n=1 Tax=Naegleria lovaniensis TaxID=51637 RepID=A0AA88KE92_NAELO|nr:uncharacterized protein C9374_010018 [Naegleria lovaniensis]KAG2375395.1 hypothetical protein C9374_010018 [Naegleria lovaniensis]
MTKNTKSTISEQQEPKVDEDDEFLMAHHDYFLGGKANNNKFGGSPFTSTTSPSYNRELIGELIERSHLSSSIDSNDLEKLASELSSLSIGISSVPMMSPAHHSRVYKDFGSLVSSPQISSSVEDSSLSIIPSQRNKYSEHGSYKLELQRKKIEFERILRESQIQFADQEAQFKNEKHYLEMEILKYKTQLEQTEKKLATLQSNIQQLERRQHDDQEKIMSAETIVAEARENTQQYKQENNALKENILELTRTLEKSEQEKSQYKRQYESLVQEHKSQVELLEKRCQKVESELNSRIISLEEHKAKGEMFDAVNLKAKNYEDDARRYQLELDVSKNELDKLREEHNGLLMEMTNLKQQVELLKNDKMYLSKEVESIRSDRARDENEIVRLENKVKEMRKEKKALYDRLLTVKEESKTEYERHLQEEIQQLRNKTQQDLESIKQNSQEVFERENRLIRESKEAAESQVEKLKRQLEDSRDAHNNLMIEYNTLKSVMEKQMSEMRTQANIKIFENERLQVTLMDTIENLKQCKKENEILNKKLDVMKTECYTLQSTMGKKITELETKYEASMKELNQYQHLEKDLDTIMQISGQENSSTQSERIASEISSLVPTGKRVKNSIQLAKKVFDLEKQLAQKTTDLDNAEKEITTLTERLNKTKKHLETAAQPYNYLIKSIEEKDKEMDALKKNLRTLEKDFKHLKHENEKLRKIKSRLEQDIDQLLQHNNVTSKLKDLLLSLKHEQERGVEEISHPSTQLTI